MLKTLVMPLVAASILFIATSAQAHKLRVFAYESGGKIVVEVEFNSGRPAKEAEISVEAADGRVLLAGRTDTAGNLAFAIPAEARRDRLDLTIVADAGEGHRGTWLLQAIDYLGEGPAASAPGNVALRPAPAPSSPVPVQTQHNAAPDYGHLEKIVEKVVARELAPIKRLLAQEKERQVSLQDILGGLGYIFGIAGIVAYVKSRSQHR